MVSGKQHPRTKGPSPKDAPSTRWAKWACECQGQFWVHHLNVWVRGSRKGLGEFVANVVLSRIDHRPCRSKQAAVSSPGTFTAPIFFLGLHLFCAAWDMVWVPVQRLSRAVGLETAASSSGGCPKFRSIDLAECSIRVPGPWNATGARL